MSKAETIAHQVLAELYRAQIRYTPMTSAHDGYAKVLEELDEAWDEIKRNDIQRSKAEMIQVAAMAIRYLHDVEG